METDDFKLLVGRKAHPWDTFVDELGLKPNHALNLTFIKAHLRSSTILVPAKLLGQLKLNGVTKVFGVGVSVSDFTDPEQTTDPRATHVDFLTHLAKRLLKKNLRLVEVMDSLVLSKKPFHFIIAFLEVLSHDLDNAQDSCLVEVTDEGLDLLRDRQIVTARENVRQTHFVLHKCVEPKILTESHLRHQLTIEREMVVEVLRLETL